MTVRHILDENKRLVTEFYELAINRREPAEAARKYIELPYRQHNPEVADGPRWLYSIHQRDATEASTPKSSDFKSAGR